MAGKMDIRYRLLILLPPFSSFKIPINLLLDRNSRKVLLFTVISYLIYQESYFASAFLSIHDGLSIMNHTFIKMPPFTFKGLIIRYERTFLDNCVALHLFNIDKCRFVLQMRKWKPNLNMSFGSIRHELFIPIRDFHDQIRFPDTSGASTVFEPHQNL